MYKTHRKERLEMIEHLLTKDADPNVPILTQVKAFSYELRAE